MPGRLDSRLTKLESSSGGGRKHHQKARSWLEALALIDQRRGARAACRDSGDPECCQRWLSANPLRPITDDEVEALAARSQPGDFDLETVHRRLEERRLTPHTRGGPQSQDSDLVES